MIAEKKEAYPLTWPTDWPRTRPQDQREMRSWKKTANQYREALVTELTRMEAPSAVISSNVPLNLRGAMTAGEARRGMSLGTSGNKRHAIGSLSSTRCTKVNSSCW